MEEIVTAIKRVTDIMAEISAASPSRAPHRAGQPSITQMDEVTQQNAALVEEAASAAESLEEQAVGLGRWVSVFKMNESGALATRRQNTPHWRSPAARPATRSSMPAK